jgi:hypothetical protein
MIASGLHYTIGKIVIAGGTPAWATFEITAPLPGSKTPEIALGLARVQGHNGHDQLDDR